MKTAFLLLVAAFSLPSGLALAQPPDPATLSMRDHFGKGVKAYDSKDYPHALDEFRAAYQAKSSPAILRNIALTLKALGREAEALDTLQQFVDDSGPALKPDVRDAATSEMHDLETRVATVHVRVVAKGGAPVDAAEISVDREPVPASRLAHGIHLAPGEHVLHAHADRVGDCERRKPFAAGDSEETLELAPAMAKLHIVAKPDDADIRIDGASVRRGSWAGPLPAGKHTVVVAAPGFAPVESELALEPDQSRDLMVSLSSASGDAAGGAGTADAGAAPTPPTPPETPPAVRLKPHKRNYIELGAGFQGESLHPSTSIGGDGKTQSLGGIGLFGSIGTELGRYFNVGGYGGLLFDTKTYATVGGAQWTANTSDLAVGPELRFRTPNQPIRFVASLGPILDLRWASANQPSGIGTTVTTSGGGAGFGAQGELGIDATIAPAYIHVAFFVLAHDISAVKDNTGTRLFDDTGSMQAGLRAMVGLPF